MTKQITSTSTQAITSNTAIIDSIKYGNVKAKAPINTPKHAPVMLDCIAITAITGKASKVDNLTPMGHKVNCKGGIIDEVIISGKATCLQAFVQALANSGLKVVESDRTKYAPSTFKAVLAKRVVDHVKWCFNTSNNAHGGFGSRLEKVGLYVQHVEIAKLYGNLAEKLSNTYNGEYARLYRLRNKTGLNR